MSPDWKNKLPVIIALPLTILIGTAIAQGQWLWPVLILGLALAAVLSQLAGQKLPMILLSVLVFGYIVGNRGFAQLSPSRSLPLFPAEAGLAVLLIVMIWQCAHRRISPLSRNELDVFLLGWIVIGTIRVAMDLRTHGIFAIRDYAMVYYALFFFIARHFARGPSGANWFASTLRVSSLVMLPLFLLFMLFEGFFLNTFTFRGTPLLYYKTDLAGTFMSAGAIAWLLRYEENPRNKTPLAIGLALAGTMLATNNRASMLALIAPLLFLAIGGRWRLLKIFSIAGVTGALVLACWIPLSGKPWTNSSLYGLYERMVSIVDVAGERTYRSTAAGPKGDNNQFRTVWWTTAIQETTEANPWLGVGFGHDLAANFLRAYYPDSDEEFNVRSPHNFYVTLYARTGSIGLLLFLGVTAMIFLQAWRALRENITRDHLAAHITALALLTSAVFGVVLEGPMGAVVFWIALGVASSRPRSDENSRTMLGEPTNAHPDISSASP